MEEREGEKSGLRCARRPRTALAQIKWVWEIILQSLGGRVGNAFALQLAVQVVVGLYRCRPEVRIQLALPFFGVELKPFAILVVVAVRFALSVGISFSAKTKSVHPVVTVAGFVGIFLERMLAVARRWF